MKIIEQFTKGKSLEQSENEDTIVITTHFAAVLDGSTSKGSEKYNSLTPGVLACRLISEVVQKMPKETAWEQMIHLLNHRFKKFYQDHNLLSELSQMPWKRPAAVMAIYSRFHKEVWIIGDCQCLTPSQYIHPKKVIDNITAEVRSLFLEMEIASGKTVHELLQHDTGRNYILPLLKQQSQFQNNFHNHELSYEVVDGFPIAMNQVRVIKTKTEEVILATDGYPLIFPTLKETEEYLKKILEADPLQFRVHKSTKGINPGNDSFDDRSYIRVKP